MRRSAGFTLTEILVVIAIVAILAAILFAVFRGTRETARQAKCRSGLAQIQQKIHEFKSLKARYPQYLVAEFTTPPTIVNVGGVQAIEVAALSSFYPDLLSTVDPFICPNDQNRDPATNKPYKDRAVADVVVRGDPTQKLYKTLIYSSYAGPVPGSNVYWNYNGYKVSDPNGVQVQTAADLNTYITTMRNAGLTSPTKWPRLANRQAPDYTIVTHCPHHRIQTSASNTGMDAVASDIIVRLGGDSSRSVKFMSFNWTTQPEQ
jgi:prepilin-type N-terminal cleavage/methylation domain-containing protein